MIKNSGTVIGGALLVAGTSIGGGMLALPVLTSPSGFFPSIAIYFACWMFMASTGLLFLEISLWFKKEVNIITMARETLGVAGVWVAWGLYLFLFYSLTLAYIVGCGGLISESLKNTVPDWLGPLIFICFAIPLLYGGAKWIDPMNRLFILGLGLSFIAFVMLGAGQVNFSYLERLDWSKVPLGLPIAFTAFAYQGTIPTLVHFLQYDAKKVRLAILWGSAIPFITYVIWQALILGIIPFHGANGLEEAVVKGQNAVQPLRYFIEHPGVFIVGQFFAFFALVTSFFGVALGLKDFLADGLKIKKTAMGKLLLCVLVCFPPLFLAFLYPNIFLTALDYAGGFGCALLLGLLPVLMVWSGRYRLGLKAEYSIGGGRPFLVLLILFVLAELVCEALY